MTDRCLVLTLYTKLLLQRSQKKKNTSLFRHCALLVSKILTCEEKKNKTTMSLCTVETGYFYGCFSYERTKV